MQNTESQDHIAIASTMQHYNEKMIDHYFDQHPDAKIHISQNVMALDTIFKLFWDDQLDIAFIPKTKLPPYPHLTEVFFHSHRCDDVKESPPGEKAYDIFSRIGERGIYLQQLRDFQGCDLQLLRNCWIYSEFCI